MTAIDSPMQPRDTSATNRAARMILVVLICALVAGACGSSDPLSAPAQSEPSAAETLRIASFDFAESELLAELYAQVAEANGIPVTRLGALGPREVLSPALESGAIDLIPEYLGTALRFAGHDAPTADTATAAELLAERLTVRGLVVLEPAPAQDINVFVVLTETSREHGLVALSDLKHAGLQRFGGPVECPDRPLCLRGLADTYDVSFAEFVPQPSLMFTAESLRRGEIDVGLLFSTSPELDDSQLTVLTDDLGLQPQENLVPIMSATAFERWGPTFESELNTMLQQLTTSELRSMNRMVAGGESVAVVATRWLATHDVERAGA